MPSPLKLNDDRLLPADPTMRQLARSIYESVAALPVISPHSHVDADLLVANEPIANAAELFVTPDHYVTRMLHSQGVPMQRLGYEKGADPREIWREFCAKWTIFDGTSTGLWLTDELVTMLGVEVTPSAETADELYDHIAERLQSPEFRPQALLGSQQVAVLATTDDPLATLASHDALNADTAVGTRFAPTFRPDAYIDATKPEWADRVAALGAATGHDTQQLEGLLDALRERREYFISHGATSADHGVVEPFATRLDDATAATLYRSAIAGAASTSSIRMLSGHLLYCMAEMSAADGLVMTIHPGVLRNHHRPTFERFGPDSGHDFPVPVSFVEGLRPILQDFGTNPDFSLVLFTVDESTWSRELAPMASFYPSVTVGAPWWFLDAPDAFLRFRSAVTEIAGFANYSGFIDDTRALCSLRVRHDVARRVDAGFLARYVAEGRLSEERALAIAAATVTDQPTRVFKL